MVVAQDLDRRAGVRSVGWETGLTCFLRGVALRAGVFSFDLITQASREHLVSVSRLVLILGKVEGCIEASVAWSSAPCYGCDSEAAS